MDEGSVERFTAVPFQTRVPERPGSVHFPRPTSTNARNPFAGSKRATEYGNRFRRGDPLFCENLVPKVQGVPVPDRRDRLNAAFEGVVPVRSKPVATHDVVQKRILPPVLTPGL